MLPAIHGTIDFDDVHFRYRADGPYVFNGVSLHIRAGEVIGIVGRSGSGKSTLAKLIQRLYIAERGRIRIDGIDISLVDPAALRRQIGIVLQDSLLFAGTIYDNIALAHPGVSLDRVMQGARQAGAHDFICELPNGYNTQVGEQGAGLSGGQRQRIAIARAVVGDPRIVIFDEATSALDYESERMIRDQMPAISRNRTVIIISHRLSAVRHADRIFAMDYGSIVETGKHDELVRKPGGYYARLVALQEG
jgi:subfamily B ATP-binding cassette protein HlyB/CyaB